LSETVTVVDGGLKAVCAGCRKRDGAAAGLGRVSGACAEGSGLEEGYT
jgi:hypothetical protein